MYWLLQMEGLLHMKLTSPVMLVSCSDANLTQFYVVEASGTVWLPRFSKATLTWDLASLSSYSQLIDAERLLSSIVSVTHIAQRSLFVWVEGAEVMKRDTTLDSPSIAHEQDDDDDDATDQFYSVYSKRVDVFAASARPYVYMSAIHLVVILSNNMY